jgi:16S rRNA (uracil1498-N3)-methyltransferase
MRLHSFFIKEKLIENGEITLADSDLLHQWRSVFRFTSGATLLLCDNSGDRFLSTIVSLEKNFARVAVGSATPGANETPLSLTLITAIAKKDTFEWVVEKGTEIGVTRFAPVTSERSEKKNINMLRIEKIAREASEQCGRGTLPIINNLVSLPEAIDTLHRTSTHIIAFDKSGQVFDASLLRNNHRHTSIGVIIGPEGGWTERELSLFTEKQIPLYSLGQRTLRAETAALSVASLLLL